MKIILIAFVTVLALISCKKEKESGPAAAPINNTSWTANVTANGTPFTQNIFDFAGDGNYFTWHVAAGDSYTGSWTQNGNAVNFSFKETTPNGDFLWDSSGTLSNDGTTLTGTMQRRIGQGSGTFTAKKL